MTTYYIDFSASDDSANGTSTATPWKRAPGMVGFTGTYSHSAGDVFKFKGGVTWTASVYPWTIANSGSAGNIDTYTTDHTWYSGGAWSQPVFDAQATVPAGGMLNATSKSYFTFNDLRFVNYGTAFVTDGSHPQAIDLNACQQFTFSNLTLALECQRSFYVHFDAGAATNYSTFNWLSNTVSNCASMLWFATAGSGNTADTINIKGNAMSDAHSQLISGVHADGLVHFFATPNNSVNQTLDLVDISSNRVSGNWTKGDGSAAGISAFIFQESVINHFKIYNNAFSVTSLALSQVPVWFGGSATSLEIYNNTVDAYGIDSGIGIDTACAAGQTMVVKNNIVNGTRFAFAIESTGGTITVDYNNFNSTSGQLYINPSFQSYATWQGNGRDTHSSLGTDCLFKSEPGDISLLSPSSPAYHAGTTITGLTTDIIGNSYANPPSIGAYEYVAGSVPGAATGLVATPNGNRSVAFTWTLGTGITGQMLKWGTSAGSHPNMVTPSPTDTSSILTGTSLRQLYSFIITSSNASGSTDSTEATCTTSDKMPALYRRTSPVVTIQ